MASPRRLQRNGSREAEKQRRRRDRDQWRKHNERAAQLATPGRRARCGCLGNVVVGKISWVWKCRIHRMGVRA